MTKRILFCFLPILLFCSCEKDETVKQVIVDFEYRRIAPLMVDFTNTSKNCDSYKWDFGDGMWAYGTDATHGYEKTGTYTVTLTGTADGQTFYKRQQIKITKPVVYFTGYTLYAIPYENRYYKLIYKDDNLLPSDWDFYTVYSPLLTNADIPYSVTWQHPQQLINPESHEYYKIQVVRTTNASNTDNDVVCMTIKAKVADILRYVPELVYETETAGTRVGIKLGYDY